MVKSKTSCQQQSKFRIMENKVSVLVYGTSVFTQHSFDDITACCPLQNRNFADYMLNSTETTDENTRIIIRLLLH